MEQVLGEHTQLLKSDYRKFAYLKDIFQIPISNKQCKLPYIQLVVKNFTAKCKLTYIQFVMKNFTCSKLLVYLNLKEKEILKEVRFWNFNTCILL